MTGLALTDEQRLYLRCSATGGAHPFRLHGLGQYHVGRSLQKLGLGTVVDMQFMATPAGVAAVALTLQSPPRPIRRQPMQLAEADLPF